MKEVDFCCCGCSLRAGTLILAVLGLIGGLVTCVGSFSFLGFDYILAMAGTQGLEVPAAVRGYLKFMQYYSMILGAMVTIFSMIGLIGAANYKAGLVKIYGYFWFFEWISGVVLSIVNISSAGDYCVWMCKWLGDFSLGQEFDCDVYVKACQGQQLGVGIAGIVVNSLFALYFIWVILSFSAKLKRGEYQQLPSGQVVQGAPVVYQQQAQYAAPAPQGGVVYAAQPVQAGQPVVAQPQQGVVYQQQPQPGVAQ